MWNCKTLWQEALLICTPRVKCFINRGVSCDVLHLQHTEADFLCLSAQRSAEDWNLGASLGLARLGLCLYEEYRKLYLLLNARRPRAEGGAMRARGKRGTAERRVGSDGVNVDCQRVGPRVLSARPRVAVMSAVMSETKSQITCGSRSVRLLVHTHVRCPVSASKRGSSYSTHARPLPC